MAGEEKQKEPDIFGRPLKETIRGREFEIRELSFGEIEQHLELVFAIIQKLREKNEDFFAKLGRTSADEAAAGRRPITTADLLEMILLSFEEIAIEGMSEATKLISDCCGVEKDTLRGYPAGVVIQLARHSIKAQRQAIEDFLSLRSDLRELFAEDDSPESSSSEGAPRRRSRRHGKQH